MPTFLLVIILNIYTAIMAGKNKHRKPKIVTPPDFIINYLPTSLWPAKIVIRCQLFRLCLSFILFFALHFQYKEVDISH